MGVIITDELVKAIGRERHEEARQARPHMGRFPEPASVLGGWRRVGEQVAMCLSNRRSEGTPSQRVH